VATRSILLFIVIMGVGALCSPTWAQTFQEIRVHWEASPGAPPETLLEPQHYHPASAFTVVERRHRRRPDFILGFFRHAELNVNQLW
jgi:hypothetical protein